MMVQIFYDDIYNEQTHQHDGEEEEGLLQYLWVFTVKGKPSVGKKINNFSEKKPCAVSEK